MWAWDYDPNTMTATNQRAIVKGMNNADHVTRTSKRPSLQRGSPLIELSSHRTEKIPQPYCHQVILPAPRKASCALT